MKRSRALLVAVIRRLLVQAKRQGQVHKHFGWCVE